MKPFAAVLLFLVSSAAHAQPASAQSCTGCHGAHGEGGSTGAPRLAGQPHAYLARQLEAYADGRREHSVMTPIAKGLQPQDRDALAAYYAGLKAPANPPQVGGGDTKRGSALATRGDETKRVQACANCHGPAGSGQNGINPYLAGLDPRYLEAALMEWKSGSRKTDPSQQMVQIAKSLSEADIKALAAYYARQPAPQLAERGGSGAQSGRSASAPTKPGAGAAPAAGVGATGGEATTGGSQGPGGGGGASGSGASGSR